MAHNSINEFRTPVNGQLQSRDTVDEYLTKANALIQVALHDDFLDFPDKVIHDYLWALSEVLQKAYEHNDRSLSTFSECPNCSLSTATTTFEESGL